MEELQITLSVKDHHRNLVTTSGTTNMAHDILRDDVTEQRCLSRSSLTENDSLHDSNPIRPQPRFAKGIVAEHHRILSPGSFDVLAIATARHPKRRPFFLSTPAFSKQMPPEHI